MIDEFFSKEMLGLPAGAMSSVLFAASTRLVRVKFGYVPLFVIAGSAYLIGLLIIHLVVSKLEPVKTVTT